MIIHTNTDTNSQSRTVVIAEAFLFHKKGTRKAFRFLFFQAESLFHNTQESLGSVLLSSAASASAESHIFHLFDAIG